jgi:parallel beta-helix repeat protein
VFTLIAVLGAVPASGSHVACGDVITSDFKLMHDLGPCLGDGLIAGASGILIDLNGHTITGDGIGLGGGVRIQSPHGDVEVRNGTLTKFNEGVVLAGTSNNHLWGLALVENNRGVDLAGFNTDNLIEKNEARDNAGDGIRVDSSNGNIVQKNTVVGNVFGISVSNNAHDNLVTKNTVLEGRAGFSFGISVFSNSDGNTVEKNYVTGMAFEGIQVESRSDNTFVSKNTSNGNGTDGILVEGSTPAGTVIEKNTTNDNGDDGIDTDSAAATITKNTADGNGDLGIEAVAGVTDGGGNRAEGNGNPTECFNVTCG